MLWLRTYQLMLWMFGWLFLWYCQIISTVKSYKLKRRICLSFVGRTDSHYFTQAQYLWFTHLESLRVFWIRPGIINTFFILLRWCESFSIWSTGNMWSFQAWYGQEAQMWKSRFTKTADCRDPERGLRRHEGAGSVRKQDISDILSCLL